MRIRSIVLVACAALVIGSVPMQSEGAAANAYSFRGTLSVFPRSNELPARWSLQIDLSRLAGAGPMMPKGAHAEASGIFTLAPTVSTSGVGPAVGQGIYTVDWSDGRTSFGEISCLVARLTACKMRVTFGYATNARGLVIAQRKNTGDIAGWITLLVGGTIDK